MKATVKLALVTTLILSGCAIEPTISQTEIELAKKNLHTKKAVEYYIDYYAEADYHKAWARSKTGAWALALERFTEEDAINHALTMCRNANEKRENKYPCKVINLDGQWITP